MADETPAADSVPGATPAMDDAGPDAIIAALRDIHLPESPANGTLARVMDALSADIVLWPLALYLLACGLVWLVARRRRSRWRREARLELGRLEARGAGLEAWIELRRRVIESGRLHGGATRAAAPLPASAFEARPLPPAPSPVAALREDILARLEPR